MVFNIPPQSSSKTQSTRFTIKQKSGLRWKNTFIILRLSNSLNMNFYALDLIKGGCKPGVSLRQLINMGYTWGRLKKKLKKAGATDAFKILKPWNFK